MSKLRKWLCEQYGWHHFRYSEDGRERICRDCNLEELYVVTLEAWYSFDEKGARG